MNQAAPQPEAITTTPGIPFIHVAGDLIVRLDSNPIHSLAHLPATPVAGALAVAERSTHDDEAAPLKILADGTEVPAADPRTDHMAVLFPATGWMIAVKALSKDGRPLETQQAAEEAGKALQLLGHNNWMLAPDKVYERHVIDRRYHEPAADKNLFPNLPLSDWYWTSTAAPWSSGSAFLVNLRLGFVDGLLRSFSGFGLACRRARQ
ncbi:DUF1566 domain-containing protein [Rhodanobacter sp. OR92]|uniref:DUF1566 domain-containing protein n=1 Tax=Rhodanobacter sp. OR92 TaxID=1076524 RepID=UPI000411EB78|nr:DUF1566 domain-containing protein [Rhodanobacter sp. OR92]